MLQNILLKEGVRMTLPAKLILLLCLLGCFPPCQVVEVETDPSELYVTFVRDCNHFRPLALFRNGESLINYMDMASEDGHIWSFTKAFAPFEKHLQKETFYSYTGYASQTAAQKSVIDNKLLFYDGLPDGTDLSQAPIVVTNDPSPDFFADVKYTQYAISEQDKVPKAYREYVRKKAYTAGLVNVPILIRDVYEFDFDHDGKKEAFISAHNCSSYAPWQETIDADKIAPTEELKTEEGIGYYSYVLFYSETYMPIDFQAETGIWHDSFLITDYKAPGAIYEYGQDGEVQLFNIYTEDKEYGSDWVLIPCEIAFLAICDVNQDGRYDFMIMHYDSVTEYRPIELYLQSPDGDFIYTCGMNTLS